MMIAGSIRMSLALLAPCFLAGCAAMPAEPDYAATWPQPQPEPTVANGAIYQAGMGQAMFANPVARRVGDTLTVRLDESTQAQKSSSTNTRKATSVDLPGPVIAGRGVTVSGRPVLSAQLDNGAQFSGEGDSRQSNRLQGDIAVTVAQRLPNGNLLVRGQKWITINQGREYVRVQGIVRPMDIAADNSISSLKVADAVIAYGGKGALADASSPGLLSRFFNLRWLPF